MTAVDALRGALALGSAIAIHDAARGMQLSETELERVVFLIIGLLKLARPLLREVAP